jgi:hypothetical protein
MLYTVVVPERYFNTSLATVQVYCSSYVSHSFWWCLSIWLLLDYSFLSKTGFGTICRGAAVFQACLWNCHTLSRREGERGREGLRIAFFVLKKKFSLNCPVYRNSALSSRYMSKQMEMEASTIEATALKQGCSQTAARESHPENKAADRWGHEEAAAESILSARRLRTSALRLQGAMRKTSLHASTTSDYMWICVGVSMCVSWCR